MIRYVVIRLLTFLLIIGVGVMAVMIGVPKWTACRRHHGMAYCQAYLEGGWAWGMATDEDNQ